MAATFWTHIASPQFGTVSEFKATLMAIISVYVLGGLVLGWANLSGFYYHIFRFSRNVLFLLAFIFSRCTAKGALIGVLVAASISMWISLGKSFTKGVNKTPCLPPASTENCSATEFSFNGISTANASFASNMTTEVTTIVLESVTELHGFYQIYNLSYRYIESLGILITISVGVLASLILDKIP